MLAIRKRHRYLLRNLENVTTKESDWRRKEVKTKGRMYAFYGNCEMGEQGSPALEGSHKGWAIPAAARHRFKTVSRGVLSGVPLRCRSADRVPVSWAVPLRSHARVKTQSFPVKRDCRLSLVSLLSVATRDFRDLRGVCTNQIHLTEVFRYALKSLVWARHGPHTQHPLVLEHPILIFSGDSPTSHVSASHNTLEKVSVGV